MNDWFSLPSSSTAPGSVLCMYEGSVNLPPCTLCCLEADKSGISGQGKVESPRASVQLTKRSCQRSQRHFTISLSQKRNPHHPKPGSVLLIGFHSGTQICRVSGGLRACSSSPPSHQCFRVLSSLGAAVLYCSLQWGLSWHRGCPIFLCESPRSPLPAWYFTPKSVPVPPSLGCLRRGR